MVPLETKRLMPHYPQPPYALGHSAVACPPSTLIHGILLPNTCISNSPPSNRCGGIPIFQTKAGQSTRRGLPKCRKSVYLLGMGVGRADLAGGGGHEAIWPCGCAPTNFQFFDEEPDFRLLMYLFPAPESTQAHFCIWAKKGNRGDWGESAGKGRKGKRGRFFFKRTEPTPPPFPAPPPPRMRAKPKSGHSGGVVRFCKRTSPGAVLVKREHFCAFFQKKGPKPEIPDFSLRFTMGGFGGKF
jgi:hypothetical protein